ncbi:CU044_2847 family protein [Streptomyces sp. ISL-99]|uniref:CU044_2847 family protein n=1 Tax=Streptomyces sp. ISL-99 TaxID=2819193 RepID=UPI0027E40D8C|nr:CU044_2847 family protein [Streptomyces sp. ISL-99]
MSTFMEFGTENGVVLVEADGLAPGQRPVSRGGNSLVRAGQTLDEALAGIRTAAESALAVFRGGSLQPDGVELEFGVKLTAEAGAVIARTAVEGHLTVRLSWTPEGRGVEHAVSVPDQSFEPRPGSRDVPQRAGSGHEVGDEAMSEAR